MLRDGDCRRCLTACGVAVQGEMNAIVWRAGRIWAAAAARQVMQSITDAATGARSPYLAGA